MSKNKKIILISIFLGVCFRFFLSSLTIDRGDILVHFDWSRTLYQTGIKGSYSYPIWIYSPPTQPPLMMFNFWLSRHFYVKRYYLSKLHNLIKIPPSNFILWFDKYGESIMLKIWAMAGDIICSLFIYWIIEKISKNKKLALIGFFLFYFNPITIFETSFWGQNDIYGSSFILISFLFLLKNKFKIFSPLFFLLGILAKPTGLIIAPFYGLYYLMSFNYKNIKDRISSIFQIILSAILSISLTIYSFSLFLQTNNLFNDIFWILKYRISNASKGISLASVSAFNLYSLFFNIDRTPGTTKILGLSLDSIGFFIYFLINLLALYLLVKYKKNKNKYSLLMFLIFLIIQGSFLFMTSMLDRYFLLALIPSIVLMICHFQQVGKNMIIQLIIWFINLIYAFYWRDYGIIKSIFLDEKLILIRLLSLISVLNFFYICKNMINYIKNQNPPIKQ